MKLFGYITLALFGLLFLFNGVQSNEETGVDTVIGIDLGTTYSCVGIWKNDRCEIIPNDQGNRTTPSFVAFTETERLIGDAAKSQAALNAVNTVFDAKRLIESVQVRSKAFEFEEKHSIHIGCPHN